MPESPGEDKEFFGEFENGGEYGGFTFGIRRKPNKVNEDCAGVNRKARMLAVSDGIGGYRCGEHASHLAVSTVLEAPETLRLRERVLHAQGDVSEMGDFIKSSIPQPQTEDEQRSVCKPSATLVAAHIRENEADMASFGDGLWFHLRKGRIIAKSIPDTVSFEELFFNNSTLINRTAITEQEFTKATCFHPLSRIITNSILELNLKNAYLERDASRKGIWLKRQTSSNYATTLSLQPGDQLLLLSDGCNILSDLQIEALSQLPLAKAIKEIQRIIREANTQGQITITLEDGTNLTVKAPKDDASAILYKHSKPPVKRIRAKTAKRVKKAAKV